MNPVVDVGQYRFCFENCPPKIVKYFEQMYDESLSFEKRDDIDYFLSVNYTSVLRRFVKPQVCLYIDNQRPFNPVHPDLLMPSVEWGMNWCIASLDYSKLLIHSSVLVKNGKAIIFPATPGSGKSTLSAYFALHGWHLYSDEMAIINFNSNTVKPMHRPASMKNKSIEVIKRYCDEASLSETTFNTHKGDIAHVKLKTRQQFDLLEDAKIVAVVFPKFKVGSELLIQEITKVEGFAKLVHHSFNYSVLGETGFSTLKAVVENCTFFTSHFSSYDGMGMFLQELVD
ncbi:MAG: HprK-related kinase A [Paraglaciecola sp.]|uniref:HprK-related kinase A n=1 Tax=Paraglaciecola sp. TaxID=1920173 RepID=UPI0032971927